MKTEMKTEVLIIGGGPAGCAAAMFLARLGIQSTIVEMAKFPRYHIGESFTGEAGAVMRELGLEDKLLAARHPIKHGVTVYGTGGKNDWFVPVMQRLPDSSLQQQYTWQVRRSVFDTMLLDEAVARGATLVPGKALKPLVNEQGVVGGAQIRTEDGSLMDIAAEITLDCTGLATWLANVGGVTGPKYLGAYDKQIAIFSQVEGYVRDHGEPLDQQPGNTHIFYKTKYHWAWAIPIDDEVVSVGVVAPSQYFQDKNESKPDYLRRELKELNPELARRIPEVKFAEDVHVIPNYSFQLRKFAGPGYICVGDAHRFIDPIFSLGLYVSVKEAFYAAPAIRDYLNGKDRDSDNPFHDYMVFCEQGLDKVEDLIDTFWENPLAFAVFTHSRYRESVIDVLAGRVFEDQIHPGLDLAIGSFRELLKRERTYDADRLYSVPIGSRYRAERAPLWNSALDTVETTEKWIRER
jgi:flavin-dependent dehydrogenase